MPLVERPGYEPRWQTPRLFGLGVDRFERRWDDGAFSQRLLREEGVVTFFGAPGTVRLGFGSRTFGAGLERLVRFMT
jgi:hypothetical protein